MLNRRKITTLAAALAAVMLAGMLAMLVAFCGPIIRAVGAYEPYEQIMRENPILTAAEPNRQVRIMRENVGIKQNSEPISEDIFLGEATPVRLGKEDLRERVRRECFGADLEGASLQVMWEQGGALRPLEDLAAQRPKSDTSYRVRVYSGALEVAARDGELFQLQGGGMTLYSRAEDGAAKFTGLPYGRYTVTAMSSEESRSCLLGLCEENDTVDPARRLVKLDYGRGSWDAKS